MTIDDATIARKAQQATDTLSQTKGRAATLAADPNADSQAWAQFANVVAELEGTARAWSRLQLMAEYMTKKGLAISEEDVVGCAFELLSGGADDEWSGRGNDVKRARFDGIRKAANDMKWI